jgi:hypothetical protein
MNYITRDEAISLVGLVNVDAVDAVNCDVDQWLGDMPSVLTFSAYRNCQDVEGNDVTIKVYYWQDAEVVNSTEDLSDLDWSPVGYRVL